MDKDEKLSLNTCFIFISVYVFTSLFSISLLYKAIRILGLVKFSIVVIVNLVPPVAFSL